MKKAIKSIYHFYPLEKRSYFLLSLSLGFVLIFGIAFLIAYQFYRNGIRDVVSSNEARANLLSKIFFQNQKVAIEVIESYAARRSLINSVRARDFKGTVRHLSQIVMYNPEIEGAFVADPVGVMWAKFPTQWRGLNRDMSGLEWYKGVSKEWTTYVSDVFKKVLGEKDLAVVVCSPVRDDKGKVIGILACSQSIDFIKEIVSELGLDIGPDITLIDRQGHIVYSNKILPMEVTDYPQRGFLKKALKGERANVEIRDPFDKNRAKLVSFSPVGRIGWSVIVEKARDEVLQAEFAEHIQIIIIATLAFMIFALSLFHSRGTHRQLLKLRESTDRLKYLSLELLTAQENERKWIANDLHDSLGSSLGRMKFKVDDILERISKGEASRESVEPLAKMLQECAEENRRIQMDLRPPMLDELGILPTLSWHCRRFHETYTNIDVNPQLEILEEEIPKTLKMVIYRISQEGLNNVAKYSKATQARISLRKTNGKIELAISDNGLGFDVATVLSKENALRGLGLSSMRERAELSGGIFTIESVKGKGTTITASWQTTSALQ